MVDFSMQPDPGGLLEGRIEIIEPDRDSLWDKARHWWKEWDEEILAAAGSFLDGALEAMEKSPPRGRAQPLPAGLTDAGEGFKGFGANHPLTPLKQHVNVQADLHIQSLNHDLDRGLSKISQEEMPLVEELQGLSQHSDPFKQVKSHLSNLSLRRKTLSDHFGAAIEKTDKARTMANHFLDHEAQKDLPYSPQGMVNDRLLQGQKSWLEQTRQNVREMNEGDNRLYGVMRQAAKRTPKLNEDIDSYINAKPTIDPLQEYFEARKGKPDPVAESFKNLQAVLANPDTAMILAVDTSGDASEHEENYMRVAHAQRNIDPVKRRKLINDFRAEINSKLAKQRPALHKLHGRGLIDDSFVFEKKARGFAEAIFMKYVLDGDRLRPITWRQMPEIIDYLAQNGVSDTGFRLYLWSLFGAGIPDEHYPLLTPYFDKRNIGLPEKYHNSGYDEEQIHHYLGGVTGDFQEIHESNNIVGATLNEVEELVQKGRWNQGDWLLFMDTQSHQKDFVKGYPGGRFTLAPNLRKFLGLPRQEKASPNRE